MKAKIVSLLFVFFCSTLLAQQTDSTSANIYEMTLEELLNLKISVATKTDLTLRESPSIVTVITEEEIKNNGARDLIDVFNLVPGFNFGLDVVGVVGMSARGNWTHEGKILLLIDGQEMNDIMYANTEFGQHYDINQIKRVEVIRGPGSSIYGGFAELGVINIITKSGKELQGLNVTGTYGFISDTYARRSVSAAFGQTIGAFTYSVAGYLGDGRRSNHDYTDAYGSTINLRDHSRIYPGMLNVGVQGRGYSMRLIHDTYALDFPQYYDAIALPVERHSSAGTYLELKKEIKKNRLTLTPKVNYKKVSPWKTAEDSPTEYYEVISKRLNPSVNINYEASGKINFIAGIDSYFDHADRIHGADPYFYNGTKSLSFYNLALYSQLEVKTEIPFFLSARFDDHSQYGSAFSPRLGVTKVFDLWHFKVLYSRAFRAPALANLNFNIGLKPERTGVAEIEIGYEVGENMSLSTNLYDIRISDPIVYYYNEEFPLGNYINYKKTGTRGLEFEYRYKSNSFYATTNFSYYSAKGVNLAESYTVPGNDGALLGWPQSKINVVLNYAISKAISVNVNVSRISKRYAYNQYDTNGNLILQELEPQLFLNMNLNLNDIIVKGLDFGLGLYDLLDQRQTFIQPYDAGTSPLISSGRELAVRMSYDLKVK